MRVLVQRVSRAEVTVAGEIRGAIGAGLLLLVGVEEADGAADIEWLVRKISQLRVFNDEAGVMNRSLQDCGGEALAVSQFTLYASVKKGNRPSYSRAARGEISQPMFERFVAALSAALGKPVPTGVFGADMQVSLVNDGPVTIWLDSRNPE
ncbi:D-aminoacyl-tRNA deacylase [Chromobacterium amazonense]|uniref:D-aminoacyl-tRNA deacylase n=1 Tax=Chromobacterium amazonense TaxID=1382803 RepID=A0A1S1X9H4_9NEIS|nr:D-aminoacyl-tRNA deacylase [Chromobacterium amazonense]KIA78915.1 D-tyrosyl-tRNA(Tyr) deacylase [Chromobacterium piscinae]MDE1712854.1 D-aminoacyl-tRNA deacylase [Chromobacterium amazonense]OHX16372.1 D-tyrosyl-tRNA(Tyr) deacylase [Chromobacterium amazonense]PRP69335.1 D-tyrosyl-tRNA(Tyr) deacylase [Chromobacterium amazonense]